MTETNKSDRAEGVAALQQAGEPVAWIRNEIAKIISGAPFPSKRSLAKADEILAKFSPLPQQAALVEQGVEKIIGPHEPAACGASAPSEAPRSDGKCSTCRHFTPEESGFGSCARWRMGYGISADELASDEALVENDEGWGMLVGPDFGCVLHNSTAEWERP